VSCSANKEPAAAAIKLAEDAFNTVKGELVRYSPDQTKGIEDAIKAAKENFDKRNYDAALDTAKPIPDKVMALVIAVATKKAAMTKEWEQSSGEMTGMLDSIKDRLGMLSASKKLPKTLDKAKLDGAKADYEATAKMWDEAKSAFAAGNMTDALAQAKTVKEKAMEVMKNLGMQAPEAETKS
jgi:hypothetical protein